MHKTGGFLHIQQILRCDTKRARRDKECAPQHKLKREREWDMNKEWSELNKTMQAQMKKEKYL